MMVVLARFGATTAPSDGLCFEPIVERLDHLGQGRQTELEGTLYDARFDLNIARDVEGLRLPFRNARITSKLLMVA